MIYLLLSILSSTGIFILFKLLKAYKVNTLQAIVVNYITASVFGFLHFSNNLTFSEIPNSNWFVWAVCLGVLFITIFNVMALTAQINGMSVASVATKMSMIIPIVFGIIVFKESIGVQKICGILLAFVAVYLTSTNYAEGNKLKNTFILPVIVFLGSGIIDTSVNYFAPDDNIPLFSAIIFGSAFIIGILFVIFRNEQFNLKAIPLGVILGTINYASIYFLLKALRIDSLESSDVFTLNNVAIVALSSLVGLLMFKEKISKQNWMGIFLAIISIILVTLS